MKKKRDIFAELTEGFDALKSQRERKLTPPPSAPTDAHLNTGNKAAPNPTPKGAADPHDGAVSGHGAKAGGGFGPHACRHGGMIGVMHVKAYRADWKWRMHEKDTDGIGWIDDEIRQRTTLFCFRQLKPPSGKTK